jgi:hypothetical protein
MSDTAMYGRAAAWLGESPEAGCQVLILSEDFAAYDRAVLVSRRIMDQMGEHKNFDFRCWIFSELADPDNAHTATKYGGIADMILISTQHASLPAVVNEWLDALHLSRFCPDGVLVLVLNRPASRPEIDRLLQRMENLAVRLVMDFMPLLPATEETAWQPQSQENWDMMLGRPDVESPRDVDHWGLNE